MFNIGDKVICVKKDMWGLEVNKIYTVNLIDTQEYNQWIKVNGDWWHNQENFRLYYEENEI